MEEANARYDIERNTLHYYLAASLLEIVESEAKDTREITRRCKQRKTVNYFDLSETEFRNRFRLSKEAFNYLCEKLRRHTSLRSTERISLELKVLCALSFFATGSYQRMVGMSKHLGQTSVSKFVKEVTEAIISRDLISLFIKFPTSSDQRDAIKNQFYSKFGFPGVIGCVDGCHFHIFTPKKDVEHLFYCRKHFYSLNVQMICDSNCRILNVNAKYGGASHDAFIWENSVANTYMQELHRNNEHVWLLGDSGYPLRPWLMTPITDAVEGSPEARYTSIHGKARVTIENTFGRLKNRWRCLCKDRTLHYSPKKCAKIIMACSVLHNLAQDFNVSEPEELPPVGGHGNITSHVIEESGSGDDLLKGRAIRNELVSRMSRLHL